MWMIVAVLLAQQVPALPPPQDTSGAYLDPGARALVAQARAHRNTVDAGIREYTTLMKQRVSVGLKALRRDRLLVGLDEVARIHWRAEGAPSRVDILAARQSTPMFTRGYQVPEGLKGEWRLAFDPTDDRLQLFLRDSAFVRHPLANGSERYYRFASGDTTTVRLPGGRTLRLLELRVIPRRDDVHLLRGSLWIDAASHGVVRGIFRLAADFDLERDGDPDDAKDIKQVPGLLKPIRAHLSYLTIEYGLVDLHWWLPRLIAVEGSGQIGALARFPVRFERVYSDYTVVGDTAATRVAAAPRAPRRGDRCSSGSPGQSDCECKDANCAGVEVHVPADTLALLNSPELPPPPASAYADPLIPESQLEDIARRLSLIPAQPWRLTAPTLHWGLGRAGLVRYNRVEGLSVGAHLQSDLGRLTADGTVRLGVAAAPVDSPRALRLTPDVVAGLTRRTAGSTLRLAAYRRLDIMDPASRALGFGNSFNAFFFGRDDGDYFRALGAELTRHAPADADEHVSWRLFAERQSPVLLNTEWSVRRIFGGGPTFRANLAAQPADEAGAELLLRFSHGVDAARVRWGANLALDGAAGTFDYARPAATLQLGFPLPFGLVASTEAAGGSSVGTPPLQREWFLGGPASLRGYPGDAVHGTAFWRARAELATSFPAARLAAFGDAGWAGDRDAFSRGRPLFSAGLGASLLDGYIRVDLARALSRGWSGWRLDLYLDGML